MDHSEFKERYYSRKLDIRVNRSVALGVLKEDILSKKYQRAYLFWTYVWILSIPAIIGVSVWQEFWFGLLLLLFLPRYLYRLTVNSACSYILSYAVESGEFYDLAVENEIIRISKWDGEPNDQGSTRNIIKRYKKFEDPEEN